MRPPPARCRMGPRRPPSPWPFVGWSPWKIGTHSASLARAAISLRTSSALYGELAAHFLAALRCREKGGNRARSRADEQAEEEGTPMAMLLLFAQPQSNCCRVDQLLGGRDRGAGRGDRNRAPLPDVPQHRAERRAPRPVGPARGVAARLGGALGCLTPEGSGVPPGFGRTVADTGAGLGDDFHHLLAAPCHLVAELRVRDAVNE